MYMYCSKFSQRTTTVEYFMACIAPKGSPKNGYGPFAIHHLFIHLGPAESLFQESYYELMKKALKPDGLLCCQGIVDYFT